MGRYGAGVLPIAASTGRALVLLRSALVTEPLTWAPPGGAVELVDRGQPARTAIREFYEETRRVPRGALLPLATVYSASGPFHQFVLLEPDEFVPRLDWENDAYAWLTIEELLALPDKHPGFAGMLAHSELRRDLCAMMEGI